MSHLELRDAYELTEQQASTLQGETMRPDDMQVGGSHYVAMPIQPWAVVDTWPREQRIGFYKGNQLKYTMRAGSKDDETQEAKKAAHYAAKLVETMGRP